MFFSGRSFDSKHQKMVMGLVKEGVIQSKGLKEAFLKVKRSDFVPPENLREAYDLKAINLIPGKSSISQPQVVAAMLEGLQVERGHRVLEIGTASGYNAALLASLTGEESLVYTIEIEESLVKMAQENLQKAGYSRITLVQGDGCKGYPPKAPYQRIMITASSSTIPPPLWSQLEERGRLVLPYNFYNLITLLLALVKEGSKGRVSIFAFPVLFVPLKQEKGGHFLDLSKYRRYLNQAREEELVGFSLALISYYQKRGSIQIKEINAIWNQKGRPDHTAFHLSLDSQEIHVRWKQE